MTALQRLARWLRANPEALAELLDLLRVAPVLCEGFGGPCRHRVLWPTPSQTQYEWDGQGEDPNADKMLCPKCSEEYTEMMDDQWAEYRAGLL